ncbi:serine/threonine-protein phosphatase 7 long form-like protein [Pyrus ussuriensis x Pyrus communis]|uniref:Serine/threonine-protein phosphatase 7 long form-like protein n=1 Tax=Pyrus ussuriensis x Pyrus communis TaxID=2448454 RepID=A0A5N5H9D7_9ROSA|nr:serine/threonine-protein phosphatase 7 long form-like protein [Pyrus ussuriensis x Pyrus communis]
MKKARKTKEAARSSKKSNAIEKHIPIVVSAFVECWQPEANTFHLPIGEMTITLDDVSNLLGVPLTGKAISLQAEDVMSNHELLVELLGVNDEEATEALSEFNEEYVTLSWLRKRFEGVSWEPYTSHRQAQPFHEITYFTGMLKCFDVVEPYCPERVLRQFGHVQTIPKALCVLPRSRKATHASVNKVLFEYIDGM